MTSSFIASRNRPTHPTIGSVASIFLFWGGWSPQYSAFKVKSFFHYLIIYIYLNAWKFSKCIFLSSSPTSHQQMFASKNNSISCAWTHPSLYKLRSDNHILIVNDLRYEDAARLGVSAFSSTVTRHPK